MKKKINIRNTRKLVIAKAMCTLMCVAAFLLVLFTAGASDMELITVPQTVLRTMIGGWIFAAGMLGNRICRVQMIKQRRRISDEIRTGKIASDRKIKSVA